MGLLPIVPLFPLLAYCVLTISGRSISHSAVSIIGTIGAAVSLCLSVFLSVFFLQHFPLNDAYELTLWNWIDISQFISSFSLRLDPLSIVMILTISFVAFLILFYSTGYMASDESYGRFFAYMNLFLASMLLLVLADDFLVLLLGWEGVGLCSYLLIGFWYKDPLNVIAARKAFIVTRIGDAAFVIGIILLFTLLDTMSISDSMDIAEYHIPYRSPAANAAAFLFLAGAIGKSAQLPLQVWLPDAMAGPTPVSALIHAATMVTAGVYLLLRTHFLLQLSPFVQWLTALIGVITLVIAALAAIAQHDIKKVLAYSTISQIGFMFLAVGVGSYTAALFHFSTHACFKSLLFLSAGAVILALDHEQDLFKMGGLRKELPFTFFSMLIGAASISAFPFVTAGFYSKEQIIYDSWASNLGNVFFWVGALLGTLLTSIYSFRLLMLTFGGPIGKEPKSKPGLSMVIPMVIFIVFSIATGIENLPSYFKLPSLLSDLLKFSFPSLSFRSRHIGEISAMIISASVSVAGITATVLVFAKSKSLQQNIANIGWVKTLGLFFLNGWGFDKLYKPLFVDTYLRITGIVATDIIGRYGEAVAAISRVFSLLLNFLQNGNLRWYAAGIAIGALIITAIGVF